ncbi:MAG: transposase [Spirochaetia bacterium]|nr:transposase [Spirochaetia bacterium]
MKRLMAIKGIGTFTALSIIAEISDFRRFAKPSQFMSYLGLVPAEHSSGERRRQNGITKSGNKAFEAPVGRKCLALSHL